MKLSTGLVLAGLSFAAATPWKSPGKITPPKGKWFDRKLNDSLACEN
jgi:hypothetical protein